MMLFAIKHNDWTYHVEATGFDDAIKFWLAHQVAFENDWDGTERPDEVVLVSDEPVIRYCAPAQVAENDSLRRDVEQLRRDLAHAREEADQARLAADESGKPPEQLAVEVGQLRAQLAAAVAEVNRLARDAGAYHNLRAEVLQRVREDVDAERRRQAAEMEGDAGPAPEAP